MSWEITEKGIYFGKLTVRSDRWWIQTYYAGPDRRYKGYIFRLEDDQVPKFADDLENSWSIYQKALATAQPGEEIHLAGRYLCDVQVGGTRSGVIFAQGRDRVNSYSSLQGTVNELRALPKRVGAIRERARTLYEFQKSS